MIFVENVKKGCRLNKDTSAACPTDCKANKYRSIDGLCNNRKGIHKQYIFTVKNKLTSDRSLKIELNLNGAHQICHSNDYLTPFTRMILVNR